MKTITYEGVQHGDWVRCVLCGAQMLLPCGADKCPECGENGTFAHWLNYVTCISYNRYKPVMEVECNECTSKLFVDMIKSICEISEQVKSFINPEQIKAIAESNEPILLLSNN